MRTTDFMDKQMTMGLSRSRSDDDFSAVFSPNSSSLHNNSSLMDHFDLATTSRQRVGASDTELVSAIDRKVKEYVDNVLYAVEGISARLSQLETRTRRLEGSIDDLKESVEHNQGRADGKLRELENILREVQGGVVDLKDKQEIAEAQVQLAKLQALKNDRGSENPNNSMQKKVAPEIFPSTHQQTPKPHSDPPVSCPQQLSVPPTMSYQEPQPLPAATAPQLPVQMPPNPFYSIQQHEPYYPPPTQAPEIMHQQYHMHSTQHFPPQHLPPQPSTQHMPPQPSAQHLPPQSSAQHFPQQPSGQHLPPQSSAQHLPSQPSAQHLPSQPSAQHLPSQPSAHHLPQQPSAHHWPPQLSVQHQPYGSAPEPLQTSQLQQLPELQLPVSAFNSAYHPANNHQEENSYMPPQTYPPSAYNPSQPRRASQTQQPYVGSAQQMHDQPSSGYFSEFPSAYSQPPEYSNFGNIYPNSGPPTNYRNSTMKSSHITEPPSASTTVNSHSRLPTAKLLPQALPTAQILPEALLTANRVDGGSSSGGTGNKVPVDDVVEKVVAMGFRRDLVRATVRKMTENGQPVNLNAVLDKVMND